jgi:nitroreductase
MRNVEFERPLSVLDAIYTRRSVRSYANQRLDEATIRTLLDAAVQAPNAMLEQPWLFVVVQDRTLLRSLSDLAKTLWTQAPAFRPSLHGHASTAPPSAIAARVLDPAFDIFYAAPVLIVICARHPDDFITADCWLAAENLMLAACALGLGSCCIGGAIPALNTPEGQRLLGVPEDVTAVAPIVVGAVAGAVGPAPRRDPEILCWR